MEPKKVIRQDEITFDGSKGIVVEECPLCHVEKWLGKQPDGTKMCQDCYFKDWSQEELKSL